MNESYFELIFAIFDEKLPFLPIFDTFWAIFGPLAYSTSIHDSLTIESSFELNQQNFLELNNILNWILGKAILNWILNESFFWQNSYIELNQIGYRPPLTGGPPSEDDTNVFCRICFQVSVSRGNCLDESGFDLILPWYELNERCILKLLTSTLCNPFKLKFSSSVKRWIADSGALRSNSSSSD